MSRTSDYTVKLSSPFLATAPNPVAEVPGMNQYALAVWESLVANAGRTTIRQLADTANQSTRSTKRAIHQLQRMGLLSVFRPKDTQRHVVVVFGAPR